jgi:hypothetical protein
MSCYVLINFLLTPLLLHQSPAIGRAVLIFTNGVGGGGGAVVAGKILLVKKGFLPVEEQSGSNRPKES